MRLKSGEATIADAEQLMDCAAKAPPMSMPSAMP